MRTLSLAAVAVSVVLWQAFAVDSLSAQPVTRLASSSTGGTVGNFSSWRVVVSEDGNHVAFASDATNLVPNDTNNKQDIFVKNMTTGVTIRASVDARGGEGNGHSDAVAIAPDASFVVFSSDASNLVANDTNNATDLFLKVLATGAITRISVSTSGAQGNGRSYGPRVSPTGRFVVFESYASNFVPGDNNNALDVFIRDLSTGRTVHASLTNAGGFPNDQSSQGSISADGRFVTFISKATDVVPRDTNGARDVFIRDTILGTTALVSADAGGAFGNGDCNLQGKRSISDDGRFVVFSSRATNLVPNDTNNAADIFVKDVRSGAIVRANLSRVGTQAVGGKPAFQGSISADGRYVVFSSPDGSLVANDFNGTLDVFLRDLALGATHLVSVATNSRSGNSESKAGTPTRSGRRVAFRSAATDLVSPPTAAGSGQMFVRDRGITVAHSVYLSGGCNGTAGAPPYLTTTPPIVGRAITLSGDTVAPRSTGFLLLGARIAPGIPIGRGCVLHVQPSGAVTIGPLTVDGTGRWVLRFAIPNVPALSGVAVAVQAAFPGTGPFGLDVTNGLELRLGS